MADETQPSEEGRRSGFVKELSSAAAKKALAPIAATAATAGTAYLMRKGNEIWQERVAPKMREKGGGKAVAKDALEKGSELLGGRGSEALSGLAERFGGDEPGSQEQPAPAQTSPSEPDGKREQERKKRQQRRQERQRALEQSGST
jgi:hypothetical protein